MASNQQVISFLGRLHVISDELPDRGIREETCRRFGFMVALDRQGVECHVGTYYDSCENLVAAKKLYKAGTIKDKKHSVWVGEHHIAGFFGQQLWEPRHGGWPLGRTLVITEGEIDCMTVSQLAGESQAVVSVPKGAGSAKNTFQEQRDFLDEFDRVVLMFDMDDPGQDAVRRFSHLLPPGKGYLATLPFKDANECYLKGCGDEVLEAIWDAEPLRESRDAETSCPSWCHAAAPPRPHTGKVKWFDKAKGFGFIIPDDASRDMFVHWTGISVEGYRYLEYGEHVEYDVERGEDGRPRAADVRLL